MGIPLSSIDKELCMNFIKKLSDVLDAIVSFISGFLMAVLTIITLSGVVFRYVLGNPISWVYEFTIVSFAWMISSEQQWRLRKMNIFHSHLSCQTYLPKCNTIGERLFM